MRSNPRLLSNGKGTVIREAGARPKPHEYMTAEALADSGYNVKFIPSSKVVGMADCYINNTIYEIKAPEGRTIDCIERNLRKTVDHQSIDYMTPNEYVIYFSTRGDLKKSQMS